MRRSPRVFRETAKLKAPRTPAFAELRRQKDLFSKRTPRMELEERKVVSKLAHLSSWKKHVALQMGKTALRGGVLRGMSSIG